MRRSNRIVVMALYEYHSQEGNEKPLVITTFRLWKPGHI